MHKQSPVIGVLFPRSRSCDFLHARVVFMQCQTATLNSFRSILMDAPKPRTLSAPIRSAVLAGKRGNLQFHHLNVVLLPSKYLSFTPLSSHQLTLFLSTFNFFSLCLFDSPMSLRFLSPLSVAFSPSIFTAPLWMFFFPLPIFLISSCKMSH